MINLILYVALISIAVIFLAVVCLLYKKGIHVWILSYLKNIPKRSSKYHGTSPKHILFCFADHFEPYWKRTDKITANKRVDFWVENYPKFASQFVDADGKHPQHTFFYPQEEYDPQIVQKLADICKKGFGEIEVHLHHDQDTADAFRKKINNFIWQLREKNGLLPTMKGKNTIQYAFIHGNWALDNSRKDGKWCGINNEIEILLETGCYADFTLPAPPGHPQTKKINSIYYAKDDPLRPNSQNTGKDVKVGGRDEGDLLMIQGPLDINWKCKKAFHIFPKLEYAEVGPSNPPTKDRIDLWIKRGIHVLGRPEWIFVKVYGHGAPEETNPLFLNEPLIKMHRYLNEKYNDGKNYVLHYVTAREMVNVIKAAEAGAKGDPGRYRDYLLTLLY